MTNSFEARKQLIVDGQHYTYWHIGALDDRCDTRRLPFCLKVLLENLLRHEDGVDVTAADIESLAGWVAKAEPDTEIGFTPARVILQDFTGVPAVVDLAAMRDAVTQLGGDPQRVNPLSPVELVVDHSVQVDNFARPDALSLNTLIEFERNRERYEFLHWGQQAFDNFRVVPPNTGIVHQVNLEHLARVVFTREESGEMLAYPDTLVGTDSHTTMINALGILGWGVGGIEAEAAMLGQPVTMLIPQVVGFRLTGQLPEGATATDLVLTVVQMLRKRGVVGKFVEFFGTGLAHLPLADRATIANMAPEYGATCGIFPIDDESLRYLRLTGRSAEQIALVEAYARAQGMFREEGATEADYSDVLELDMGTVEPSIAGPKRPQDRIPLRDARRQIDAAMKAMQKERAAKSPGKGSCHIEIGDYSGEINDGAVVIAAITSCTNTSNPAVMLGAGLLARNVVARGLMTRPWVKTSLAPGSQVVTDYLRKAGLMDDMEALGFHLVGYGCTTCIGNSGPLPAPVSKAIADGELIASAVLSGNRNFEGRVHAEVRMNFLASPPLVIAYAIAGRADIDLYNEALGEDNDGKAVFLRDVWPSSGEINDTIAACVDSDMFRRGYANVFAGDERWATLAAPATGRFQWNATSTYVQNPPYFEGLTRELPPLPSVKRARVLALLGDSITTDHISPAGAIGRDSPAGRYLRDRQVPEHGFNSYGSRRGNHEVMMRGTFANIRLRNLLAPGTEGGVTVHQPSGEQMAIYDAAMRYADEGVPLVILAGKEYGSGSSRDWAAKGTLLLGVKAVLAVSYERIHRSNLVGMGVLPLQFRDGEDAGSLGLTGRELISLEALQVGAREMAVLVEHEDGDAARFTVRIRIDTPKEWEYYRNGGILQYVLRQLVA